MTAATATAPAAAPAAKKKSFLKSKKGIMVIVGVLVVAFVAYKVLAPKPKPGPPVAGDVVSLQASTLNLAGGHYLKIAVDIVLVKGKATSTDFQMSKAEQQLIDEWSDKTVAAVSTDEARQKLADDYTTQLKKLYPNEIFATYLTTFVTQ